MTTHWMKCFAVAALVAMTLDSTSFAQDEIEQLEAQAKQALRRLVAEVKNDNKGPLDSADEGRERVSRQRAAEALERVIEDFKKELQQTIAKPEKVNRLSREGLGLRLIAAMQLTGSETNVLIDNLAVPNTAIGGGENPFHNHPFATPLPSGCFIPPLMQRYLTMPEEAISESELHLAAYLLKSTFEGKSAVPLAIIRSEKAGRLYPRNPNNIDRLEAALSK